MYYNFVWIHRTLRVTPAMEAGVTDKLWVLFPCAGYAYYKQLQKAIRDCGLPPGKIHDFRHTFGATLAKEGVHIGTIKELMGHQDIKTTMRYLHFALKHLSDSIGKLSY